ncbi:MAG TPA: hypothetical protein VMI10_05085 [Terriglobales bacterium]|nr:hypothetical protein [Terriglobales bacterium]
MTIAAGFVCMDGLVLCADTQEVIPGYTKNRTEKVHEYLCSDKDFGMVIAGAGEVDLIEAAVQNIDEAISNTRDDHFYGVDARKVIENTFRDFFRKNIGPYAAFPRDDRPAVDLLIALYAHQEHVLLKASGSTVREVVATADCIGTGSIFAKSLIEKFYSPFMHLDEVAIAAAYIMYQVEKYEINCGGPTDLYVVSPKINYFGRIPPVSLAELEPSFQEFDDSVRSLVGFVNCNMSDDDVKRIIGLMQSKMLSIRDKLASSGKSHLYSDLSRLTSKPLASFPSESDKK